MCANRMSYISQLQLGFRWRHLTLAVMVLLGLLLVHVVLRYTAIDSLLGTRIGLDLLEQPGLIVAALGLALLVGLLCNDAEPVLDQDGVAELELADDLAGITADVITVTGIVMSGVVLADPAHRAHHRRRALRGLPVGEPLELGEGGRTR